MNTILGVRTNRHCKPDQTLYLCGAYAESDAQIKSDHARLLKIIFVMLMMENCLYISAMLACGNHIQLQLQNHPAQVAMYIAK